MQCLFAATMAEWREMGTQSLYWNVIWRPTARMTCWLTNVEERCPLFTQRDSLTHAQLKWSAGLIRSKRCRSVSQEYLYQHINSHITHTHTCRYKLLIACNTSGFTHQFTELSECFIHQFCCCYPLPDCTWWQDLFLFAGVWLKPMTSGAFFSFILITE